ncbi:MAG: hypothetical protein J5634_04090 [Bacilli bacterium]|nr:hypothetical protein [Bacilli bacterium]
MKRFIKILFILFIFLFMPILTNAESKEIDEIKTKIYLFHRDSCPHCQEEIEYLEKLLQNKKYKNVVFEKYEVEKNKKNLDLYTEAVDVLDKSIYGVPLLVIGTNYVSGYTSSYNERIENTISFYLGKTYQDPVGDIIHGTDTSKNEYLHYDNENPNEFDLPVFGKVNAKSVSLLLISIVIGAIDGFNPCAMWILLFLLSILLSTKDRKKMWILGLTFILTSGLVYLIFMMSWLNVAKYTSEIFLVRYLIGIFALIFGLINLYRYIKSVKQKDVGCDVTDANKKRKIMDRIRKVLSENKLIFAILGIMLLAVSVNLIELLCSLGLPVMYTEILGLNNLNAAQYGFYLFVYILFFLIDDLIIFFIAMKTLKIKGISNKYTKYSHLIGGLIMVIIGTLMIVKPDWIMLNF